MEFSIYRLDYISSVYIHTHVGLVSAVPGALVTTRPCEDRAYNSYFAICRVCHVLARLNLRVVTPSVKTILGTEARVTCVCDRAEWQGQT